jgi:hypothetical protein
MFDHYVSANVVYIKKKSLNLTKGLPVLGVITQNSSQFFHNIINAMKEEYYQSSANLGLISCYDFEMS